MAMYISSVNEERTRHGEKGHPDALIFWLAVLERRLGLWERIEGLAAAGLEK